MAFFPHTTTGFPAPTERKRMPETENNARPEPFTAAANRKPPKQPRKKRNYAGEFRDLQSRVDQAIRLLSKAATGAAIDGEMSEQTRREFIAVAIETLKGEP